MDSSLYYRPGSGDSADQRTGGWEVRSNNNPQVMRLARSNWELYTTVQLSLELAGTANEGYPLGRNTWLVGPGGPVCQVRLNVRVRF